MKVVLAQVEPVHGQVAANVRVACAAIADAAGAELVVLPEMFLSGFDPPNLARCAVAATGEEIQALRAAAAEARVAVICGFGERIEGTSPEAFANSAIAIGPDGAVAAVYRKTHLSALDAEYVVAGNRLEVVELAGRRIGLMICFDMEFPEVARTLAARGAELLVTVSANRARYATHHETAARSRALENGIPHVYVDRVGEEHGQTFAGGSAAIDAEGRVLVQAGSEPAVLLVDVELPAAPGGSMRYTEKLRPELYGLRPS